jgi:TolB-like protein/DNA-binding SARP family transcriptional activator/Tfp pilus assembly protein PilF
MYFLQLFGGASLQTAGQPLHGAVAQRRRLALLALLAVPEPRPIARDKLIAFLWPEADTERARHLLSEALYVIRKALGESAIVAAGDELHLQPEVVSTDVHAFEAALAQEDLERALTLYRGPFLDGFFLEGAPEFERWAEQERVRLATCYQRVLEALAQQRQTAGDLTGAVDALRRLTSTDPYNARFALRLMQALAAARDRAAALQHARVHAALLREEFQADPEPEIEAYAARLRAAGPEAAQPVPQPGSPGSPRVLVDEPVSPSPAGTPEPGPAPLPTSGPAAAAVSAENSPPVGPPETGPDAWIRGFRTKRRRWLLLAAATGALLLVGVLVGIRAERSRATTPSTPVLERGAGEEQAIAIAVLPFVDLSPERDYEWFGDGIAEELIHALARLDGVRIPARTSAFAFKGSTVDVREIGRRLGVSHVLEGSVRGAGGRLRVTAQLVSIGDGYQLWSETYTLESRQVDDLFAVQDDIARSIVGTLRLRLADREVIARSQAPTSDAEAYHLYQLGRYHWNQRSPGGLERGMQLYRQALERDPSFSLAHGALAESYPLLVTFGALPPREGYTLTRAAAERALALDSLLPQAHAALGLVRMYLDHDWAGAEAQFLRALQHSPSYATGRQWYAQYLAYRGNFDAAIEEIRRAQELDPLSPAIQLAGGTVLYYARRYEQAAEQYHRVLAVEPNFYLARMQLAAVYLQQQRYSEALTEAAEAVRLSERHPLPLAFLGYLYTITGRQHEARQILAELHEQARHRHVSPAYPAAIHMGLQEHDAAFQWLDRALEARDDWMIFLNVEPVFDPLRSDPRFVRLLTRVGL